MKEQCKRTKDGLKNLIGESWELMIGRISRSVMIRVSPESLKNPTGQMITAFTVNMLIRLFPVVTNIYFESPQDATSMGNIPKWQGDTFLSKIKAMHESVQPDTILSLNSKSSGNEICCHITIGSCPALNIPGIWVASDQWIAKLSSFGPQHNSSEINPVGAYVAATLAVSETWKRIMLPLQDKMKTIKISPLDGEMNFSAFDYSLNGNPYNPPLPKTVNINRLTMIGLGAGGGAAAYTLASISGLQGTITLIDPDEVEPSNLNRYVYADQSDARKKISKVECIEELFTPNPKLKSKHFHEAYLTAKNILNIQDYNLVVAAVDNRKTRRDIQFETPKVLLDAGATELGEFRIWRILLGETECMFCKHPENEKDAEVQQAEQLSKVFGLDTATWLEKSGNNDVFTDEEVKKISLVAYSSDQQIDLPKAGQRFLQWFKKNCGRFELPEIDGEIPIPFAPVMAGILLAGEVIKEKLFPGHVLRGYYWNTLTARLNPNILPRLNRPQDGCKFCEDKVFLDQYERRWMRKN